MVNKKEKTFTVNYSYGKLMERLENIDLKLAEIAAQTKYTNGKVKAHTKLFYFVFASLISIIAAIIGRLL